MFTVQLKKVSVALLASLLALVGLASAQFGDITALYNQYAAEQQAYENAVIGGFVQQNMQNPEIQAMYQQHSAAGGGGTFEEFAYAYGATGGFTPQGTAYWGQVQQGINAQQQTAMTDYRTAQANSAAAIQAMNDSYYQNSQEMGNVIIGNATYAGASSDGTVLPYTWQPETYNIYNGQTYYVDYSGQYYQVDPNNSGWMYPINQGQ